MNYKNLGKSGLKVSPICLGTNNFGNQLSEKDSIEIINKALDCGINLIDTANMYAKGKCEEIIGNAVRGRRDEVIIATKVGWSIGQGPNQGGLSRKHILWQIRNSLKRLQTEFIDIYYLHCFDNETPLEETLRTLNYLVCEGKVRYIGCSNFTVWQMANAHEICETHDWENLIVVQPPYNLLQRDIEKEILPYCQQEGLGVLTYTPLLAGFLTGKYLRNTPPPAGSRYGYDPRFWERINKESNFALLEQIKNIADEIGIPIPKLAIAWIMKNPIITAPIVGASRTKQVEENCQIPEINIDNKTYQKLNELTKNVSASLYPL